MLKEIARERIKAPKMTTAPSEDKFQGTPTSEMMRQEYTGETTSDTKRKRERDSFEKVALKWQGGPGYVESRNDRQKEDQGKYQDLPMKTKRKEREREEDGLLIVRENKRARDAGAERRKEINAERKAEVEDTHRRASTPAPKERKSTVAITPREEERRGRASDDRAHHRGRSSGSGHNRNTHNTGTSSRDDNRRESSRTNSNVRRDFSRGDPRERTPNGFSRWPESDDYANRNREKTQEERDNMYNMRKVNIRVVANTDGSHRSFWTETCRLHRNEDQPRSWKGNPYTTPPQFSAVAVYARTFQPRVSDGIRCLGQHDHRWIHIRATNEVP